jgi:hypothetical protein
MNRWSAYLAVVGLTLATLAVGGLKALYFLKVRPILTSDRAVQEKHHSLFIEDAQFLSRVELFIPSNLRTGNAGTFLNEKLHWQPDGPMPRGLKSPLITADLRESIMRLKGDWMRLSARVTRMKYDISFFSQLSHFDYWDIESGSPIGDLIASKVFVPPPLLPIPDPLDLMAVVKIRLMLGAVTKDPLPALRDVRQLAKLLLTTENIQLVLVGLAALDHERKAYRYYVDEMGFIASAWTPIDRNVTRRASRAVLAGRGYLRLWTKPEYLDEIFLGAKAPMGFCAIANEAFPLEFSLRPVLEPKLPFEMDERSEYARLDKIFARARADCRIRYLASLVDMHGIHADFPGPLMLNRLPYARRVFGMRLSAANFGGFDAYSQAASGQSPSNNGDSY